MASTVYSNAMAEVLEYLKGIRQEDVNKIPVNVMNYFKTNANKDYVCKFDYNKSLNEMGLLNETRIIIASLCYSYWCEDEYQKQKIREILSQNERNFEIIQRDKYNPEDIFKQIDKTTDEKKEENVSIAIKPKENIFTKLLNKIRKLFKKGK